MKVGVFIGRFQPVHIGHVDALKQAASRCDVLLILVGSANACRSIKNPWTFRERSQMLVQKLHPTGIGDYVIRPVNDYPYNDPQWISDVRETVDSVYHSSINEIILFGHWKEGNDYLRWFPDWKFQDLQATHHLNATQVREQMYKTGSQELPKTVHDDFDYYKKEAAQFANYPFPDTLNFNCADAVVECQGMVALVQRKHSPGRGAWALPGGFKNAKETFKECAIRELIEETGIKVPEKVLRGSIVKAELFDSPTRSFGIPRNTYAVYFRIQPDPDGKPPKVKAADDAADCRWFPLSVVLNDLELYDDHKSIISSLTGVMPRPAYLNQ